MQMDQGGEGRWFSDNADTSCEVVTIAKPRAGSRARQRVRLMPLPEAATTQGPQANCRDRSQSATAGEGQGRASCRQDSGPGLMLADWEKVPEGRKQDRRRR